MLVLYIMDFDTTIENINEKDAFIAIFYIKKLTK